MNRLDKEMVVRGLADTRTRAQELIKSKAVKVNNQIVTKASLQLTEQDKIEVVNSNILKYVSRGGFKLEKALNVFNYSVENKVVMDIGSSTGGFTDCCLQNGAKKMICIDVGTNVMHSSLRNNPKVNLYENTNIKDVGSELYRDVELIVIDVSFISLETIIEQIQKQNILVDIICLIKPQFECGKKIAAKYNGIILNKSIHNEILTNLFNKFNNMGFNVKALDYSPIKGGDGNIEYLAYITNKNTKSNTINITSVIKNAFNIK